MTEDKRNIRVFIGSPGDVTTEREEVGRVIEEVGSSGLLAAGWSLEAIAWDSTKYPKAAIRPPQMAIIEGIPLPSQCDIAVFVFWSRIGMALTEDAYPDDHRADLGLEKVPLTGSVWELCDAMHAGRTGGAPKVLVFQCERLYPRVDKDKKAAAREQQDAVEDLFEAFKDREGRFRFTVEPYKQPEDLVKQLRSQLERIVRELTTGSEDSEQFDGDRGLEAVLHPPSEYLEWLQNEVAGISLLGLDAKDANTAKLREVYVTALTQAARDPEADDVSRADEKAYAQLLGRLAETSLYVPGDPGSGKSTFARWAALVVAGGLLPAHTVPTPEEHQERFPEALRGMLPVLCRLRDFYPRLDWASDVDRWNAGEMEAALCAWMDRASAPGLTGAILQRFLAQGRLLLMLDGFDEVPETRAVAGGTAYPRAAILSGLGAALPQWQARGHRVLLTSRPYGLTEKA